MLIVSLAEEGASPRKKRRYFNVREQPAPGAVCSELGGGQGVQQVPPMESAPGGQHDANDNLNASLQLVPSNTSEPPLLRI